MDAYSRLIVGWSIADHMRTELVTDALGMAIIRRQPEKQPDDERTILHSDHGCQYTSWAFGKRLRAAGLLASMGTVGDCYDNAMHRILLGHDATRTTRHENMADPRRTCQRHLRVERMLVQSNKAPFQHRNAQPRHLRDPPHQVRPRSLTPHRRCPCYGGNLIGAAGEQVSALRRIGHRHHPAGMTAQYAEPC
jgi:hypothetical protein